MISAHYHSVPGLPMLGWLADADPSNGRIEVFHGRAVETHPGWFFEGVWDGRFPDGNFHQAENVFGSGCRILEERLVFVPSTATTDHLFYLQEKGQRIIVANSLALLLAYGGHRLDPRFTGYDKINDSVMLGIQDYQRKIPTRQGIIRRLTHWNLSVDGNGLRETGKATPPRFGNYHDYLHYLTGTLDAIVANARDGRRKSSYSLYSTQSKGYDSTANNVLLRKYGLEKVFTCPEAKEKNSYYLSSPAERGDDDGRPICALLGLECEAIDRRIIEKQGFDDELLYYAALHKNSDANLKEAYESIKSPAILATGKYGEAWYTRKARSIYGRPTAMDGHLKCGDLGSHGMWELRLHHGFAHLPLPVIGLLNHRNICTITESEEMAPWRLGNAYDRPIPRRIAEEGGVPREMFGQQKAASVLEFSEPSIPLNKELRRAFFKRLRKEGPLNPFGYLLFRGFHGIILKINNYILWNDLSVRFTEYKKHPLLYYIGRIHKRLTGRDIRIRPYFTKLNGSLFCHSVNMLAEKYQELLDAQRKKPDD